MTMDASLPDRYVYRFGCQGCDVGGRPMKEDDDLEAVVFERCKEQIVLEFQGTAWPGLPAIVAGAEASGWSATIELDVVEGDMTEDWAAVWCPRHSQRAERARGRSG